MGMDNRFSTCLSFESYMKNEIIVSSAFNNQGTLDTDEFGNILNGDLVSGNQIIACTFANSNFLLHTNKQYKIINSGTTFDFDTSVSGNQGIMLENEKIQYKINASQEDLVFNGVSLPLQGDYTGTTDYDIFKVYLNGEETTNYVVSGASNVIDFTANPYVNSFNNTISVVYYPKAQTLGDNRLNLWVYLPHSTFVGGIGYEIIEGLTTSAGSEVVQYSGTDLLTKIPNINGKPRGIIYMASDDEYRRVNTINTDSIVVDEPFENTSTGSICWTSIMKIMSNDDYSISMNPENNKYKTRFNKVGATRQIGKNNTISFKFFENDNFTVLDKIPVLQRNIASQTLENIRFVVREYEENSDKYNIYTNCKFESSSSYSRGQTNDEAVTITFDKRIGDV